MKLIFVTVVSLVFLLSNVKARPEDGDLNPGNQRLMALSTLLKNRLEASKADNRMSTSENLELATQLKRAMNEDAPANLMQDFQSLKNGIPEIVRLIVFGEPVYLVNREYPEYLYTDGEEGDKKVFTWLKPNPLKDPRGQFKFVSRDNGRTFLIQSLHTYEDLVADEDSKAHDMRRRNLKTLFFDNVEGKEWNVDIVNDEEIRLTNVLYNEVLYAGEDEHKPNENQRRVFTWRGKDKTDKNASYWKVIAANN